MVIVSYYDNIVSLYVSNISLRICQEKFSHFDKYVSFYDTYLSTSIKKRILDIPLPKDKNFDNPLTSAAISTLVA